MEQFMEQLADEHWPPEQRRGYCRVAINEEKGCAMKDGNPFGPFWDELGIDFVDNVYTGLSNDIHIPTVAADWMNKWVWYMLVVLVTCLNRFPPSQHPVISLRGAPARFPLLPHNRHLHKLLRWSTYISSMATDYVQDHMGTNTYLGLHFRIGSDWVSCALLV